MLTINEMRGAMRHPVFGSPVYLLMRDILNAMADCEQELFDYVTDGNTLDELETSVALLDVVRPPRAKGLPLFDALGVDGKGTPCPALPPFESLAPQRSW